MRICCDPCTDPAAVTLRDGTKVLHFTNLPRGGTWGPFEFGFRVTLGDLGIYLSDFLVLNAA